LLRVTVQNRAGGVDVDARRLRAAVRAALKLGDVDAGIVNVVVVDDPTIHELNVRHLDHDYPTDVLSFPIEQDAARVEGDIVASADTAAREAPKYDWSAADEVLLYVVHGALHLAGFDDLEPATLKRMRAAERRVLAEFGLEARYENRAAADS
jgi:probable rRNA maturation factor